MEIISFVKALFSVQSEQKLIEKAKVGLEKFYEKEKNNITMTKAVAIRDFNHYTEILDVAAKMEPNAKRKEILKYIVKQVKMMNKYRYSDGMY